MNYYERHLGDYAKDTGLLSMIEHGAYNLLLDRYYGTEAGIPKDQVYRVAKANTKAERAAVDSVLAEFFKLQDGVWIKGRCEEEIERYRAGVPAAEEKKENDKARQRRTRERRKAMFATLSSHGIHMPWNATVTELEMHLSRVTGCDSHGAVTRDNTATRLQTPVSSQKGSKSGFAASPTDPPDPRKQIFDLGKSILGDNAGSLISKAISETDESTVGAVLGEMALKPKADPRAYFIAATKPKERRLAV